MSLGGQVAPDCSLALTSQNIRCALLGRTQRPRPCDGFQPMPVSSANVCLLSQETDLGYAQPRVASEAAQRRGPDGGLRGAFLEPPPASVHPMPEEVRQRPERFAPWLEP